VSPLICRRSTHDDVCFEAGLPPLLQRVLAARGMRTQEDLALDFRHLYPPDELLGLEGAVSLLLAALELQNRILIVADFDADGATSCVLALRALRAMGFKHVDYIVPNRFEYGYGLTPAIVRQAVLKQPDLLITVDNGISSLEGVRLARERGMRVLITDHHLPGAQLPEADAILNPNQPACPFAAKSLAGVGVVFYLMIALRSALRNRNWFVLQQISEPNLAAFLDLVALGTVADVVALERNNRILVNEGLKRIRQGRACPGILALLDIGGRRFDTLTASDLGFAVGPRLNAAGRLDDMALGIECLLSDNPDAARAMALDLDAMNQERKRIEGDMREQAVRALADIDLAAGELPAGVCIYNPAWHQGVIGILAARIKERLHRPVIAFADAGMDNEEGEFIKGSARSIAGVHIRDVLDRVAALNPGLLDRFGGHAMAAGLTLRKRDYAAFSAAFARTVGELLSEEDLQAKVMTDGELEIDDFTLHRAQQLRDLGPWGQGFPEPCFDGEFMVIQQRLLGDSHLKLVLSPLHAPQCVLDAIAFNVDTALRSSRKLERIRTVYRLDVNEYRGERRLQLMLDHLLECQEASESGCPGQT
jgi:single-stranded-DNA-specific exonuclease